MDQHRNSAEDYSINIFSVTPCQLNSSEAQVSGDDKAGTTLFFSGVFLGLVGATFTTMGLISYNGVSHFEWTRLLGPILFSVGVTFLLMAVCKSKMLTCNPCSEREERMPDMDQTPCGQSFVFTGIRHGATGRQCIPSYPAQESLGINSAYFQQVCSHYGLPPSSGPIIPDRNPPQYYVSPLDHVTSSADENRSAHHAADTGSERSAIHSKEPEDADVCCDFSPPPYEKQFALSS